MNNQDNNIFYLVFNISVKKYAGITVNFILSKGFQSEKYFHSGEGYVILYSSITINQ